MSRFPAVLALALAAPAAAAPLELSHQGRLLDASGAPLDGPVELTVTLYDAETSGNEVFSSDHPIEFDNGYYAVTFGPIDPSGFGDDLFLGLAVDGVVLDGRTRIGSVPFALQAHTLRGGPVDASEIRVNGEVVVSSDGALSAPVAWGDLVDVPPDLADGDTLAELGCVDGEIARFGDMGWRCAPENEHFHHAGDLVEGVLSIDVIPVGLSDGHVAAGNHTHTAADIGALALTGGTLTGDLDLGGNALSNFTLDDSAPTCDADHAGAVSFDAARSEFLGCDGTRWLVLASSRPGSRAEFAGDSCKDLLDRGASVGDGVYWIDPNGGSTDDAFRVQCDMTTEGGGWTLVAYNQGRSRTFLDGTFHTVAGELVFTEGQEAAVVPSEVGLTYTEIGYSTTDPQWTHESRSYHGFWIGDDDRSEYDLTSNTCQLLRRTSADQWDGELVYFAGDGGNDNGCTGGGSVFTTSHTCDDGGGGIVTNNAWPQNMNLDPLWGYNCISAYSAGSYGAYKQGPIHNQGLHAYWVR